MLESTTKTIQGQERPAVRWGAEGKVYVCDSDGDCTMAAVRALEWARENGVSQEEIDRAGTLLNADRQRGNEEVEDRAEGEDEQPDDEEARRAARRERRRRMIGRRSE